MNTSTNRERLLDNFMLIKAHYSDMRINDPSYDSRNDYYADLDIATLETKTDAQLRSALLKFEPALKVTYGPLGGDDAFEKELELIKGMSASGGGISFKDGKVTLPNGKTVEMKDLDADTLKELIANAATGGAMGDFSFSGIFNSLAAMGKDSMPGFFNAAAPLINVLGSALDGGLGLAKGAWDKGGDKNPFKEALMGGGIAAGLAWAISLIPGISFGGIPGLIKIFLGASIVIGLVSHFFGGKDKSAEIENGAIDPNEKVTPAPDVATPPSTGRTPVVEPF